MYVDVRYVVEHVILACTRYRFKVKVTYIYMYVYMHPSPVRTFN